MREQLWILPSGEAGRDMRATVFRPDADPSGTEKRRPLVVINHGTDEFDTSRRFDAGLLLAVTLVC